jgi:hypothetical protein
MDHLMEVFLDQFFNLIPGKPSPGRIDKCNFARKVHSNHAFSRCVKDQLVSTV